MQLDAHGQPDLWVNERLRVDRSIHEMLGLVKGVLLDGVVTEHEAFAMRDWFVANPGALRGWPGRLLFSRLNRILVDGRVDEDERMDLLELLKATVGAAETTGGANPATTLPLDNPAPALLFADQTYLFTGKFVYGTRSDCQRAVQDRGGSCVNRVNQQVNVLVIGCIGSRDWAHTSFGRKIEEMVRLKERGFPVRIVSEEHWTVQMLI